MKLTIINGDLTLPKDFCFEMTKNNPFFSDEGASSLPVTIPSTPENLSMLGFPNRIGRRKNFDRRLDAVLRHGLHQMSGILLVEASSVDRGISCAFITNESEMYDKWQDMLLTDLLRGHSLLPAQSKSDPDLMQPASNGGNYIADYLWDVYKGVCTEPTLDGFAAFPVYTSDGYNPCVLNQPGTDGFLSPLTVVDGGNVSTAVPGYYGITPFVYLWKLIDVVFEHCGLDVEYNAFAESGSGLDDIVVLNRCADAAIVDDGLWEDVIPSVSVGEFIVWLHDKFCAGVFVKGGSARICLLQDSLGSIPDMDLSDWVHGDVVVEYPAKSRITMEYDTSIEGAAPPAETWTDLFSGQSMSGETMSYADNDGFYFNVPTGEYYRVDNGVRTMLGSNCFRYDRRNSEDSEDLACDDRYVPMVEHDGQILPNIGERTHRHTSVNGVKEESGQPIMVCRVVKNDAGCNGTTQGNVPLTPDGLYSRCWSNYNELLLNSAPRVTVQMEMPDNVLSTMDLSLPKYYKGQKVMIVSLSYEVGIRGVRFGDCVLQLLPNYDGWITDQMPESDVSYGWEYINTFIDVLSARTFLESEDIVITEADDLYGADDCPAYTPSYAGIIAKRRTRVNIFRVVGEPSNRKIAMEFEEWFVSCKVE